MLNWGIVLQVEYLAHHYVSMDCLIALHYWHIDFEPCEDNVLSERFWGIDGKENYVVLEIII